MSATMCNSTPCMASFLLLKDIKQILSVWKSRQGQSKTVRHFITQYGLLGKRMQSVIFNALFLNLYGILIEVFRQKVSKTRISINRAWYILVLIRFWTNTGKKKGTTLTFQCLHEFTVHVTEGERVKLVALKRRSVKKKKFQLFFSHSPEISKPDEWIIGDREKGKKNP